MYRLYSRTALLSVRTAVLVPPPGETILFTAPDIGSQYTVWIYDYLSSNTL